MGIKIHQKYLITLSCQRRTHIYSGSCLTDTTFLIQKNDFFRLHNHNIDYIISKVTILLT